MLGRVNSNGDSAFSQLHLLWFVFCASFLKCPITFLYENVDSFEYHLYNVIPSQMRLGYTAFPAVIHLCRLYLHVFYWRWGISRLLLSTLASLDSLPNILLIPRMPFLLSFLLSVIFPGVKVDVAPAKLYMSSHIGFQESFKSAPVYVLNMSVHSDHKFLSLFWCFAKS